jgi:hypothetical protein
MSGIRAEREPLVSFGIVKLMAGYLEKLRRRIEDQEMYVAKQRLHGSRASVAEGRRRLTIQQKLLGLLNEERGEGAKRPRAPNAVSRKNKRLYAPRSVTFKKRMKCGVGS